MKFCQLPIRILRLLLSVSAQTYLKCTWVSNSHFSKPMRGLRVLDSSKGSSQRDGSRRQPGIKGEFTDPSKGFFSLSLDGFVALPFIAHQISAKGLTNSQPDRQAGRLAHPVLQLVSMTVHGSTCVVVSIDSTNRAKH